MSRSIMILLILFLASVPALANDEYPPFEIFGGFSILSMHGGYFDNELAGGREQSFGFQADAAYNFTSVIGVMGDFGGQYLHGVSETTIRFYEFMGGPKFSYRTEKVTVFGNVLIGVVNSGNEYWSQNALALAFGGGVDVTLNDRFAVRIIKFDWIPMHSSEEVYGASGNWALDNIRLGFGIVIK